MRTNRPGAEARRGDYMDIRCVIAKQRTLPICGMPKELRLSCFIILIFLKTSCLIGILTRRVSQMKREMLQLRLSWHRPYMNWVVTVQMEKSIDLRLTK